MIDDADDAGIGRDFDRMERKAGFLAADEEHRLADARAHRIDRDQRPADILAVGADRLHQQQR